MPPPSIMTEKNFENYELPQNLKFKTQDIIEMGGLRCTLKLDPKYFSEIYLPPNRITDAHITVEFSLGSDDLLAQGWLNCSANLLCHRCLEEYKSTLKADFEETFSTNSEIIDIMEKACQALLLASEIQQLCKKDCKGLCSGCGTNLNTSSCACEKTPLSPFVALRDRLTSPVVKSGKKDSGQNGGTK